MRAGWQGWWMATFNGIYQELVNILNITQYVTGTPFPFPFQSSILELFLLRKSKLRLVAFRRDKPQDNTAGNSTQGNCLMFACLSGQVKKRERGGEVGWDCVLVKDSNRHQPWPRRKRKVDHKFTFKVGLSRTLRVFWYRLFFLPVMRAETTTIHLSNDEPMSLEESNLSFFSFLLIWFGFYNTAEECLFFKNSERWARASVEGLTGDGCFGMRQCWQILTIIIRYYFHFSSFVVNWTQPYPPLPLTMSLRILCPHTTLTRYWILSMPTTTASMDN